MGVGGPTQWCHKSPLPSQAPQGAPSTTSKVWRARQVQENPKRPKGEPWGSLGKPKSLGRGQGILPGWGGGSSGTRKGLDPGLSVPPPGIAKGLERWAWDFHGSDDSPPPQQTPWIHASFPLAQAWGFQKGLSPCHGDCLPLRLPAQEPVPTLRHLRRGPHSLQRSLPKPRQD